MYDTEEKRKYVLKKGLIGCLVLLPLAFLVSVILMVVF